MRTLNFMAKTMIFAAIATLATACNPKLAVKQLQLSETVDSFATYYYNWQFREARNFVTDESEIWLRYMASQVSENDLELLNSRNEAATCETADVTFENDSTATVAIVVGNHLHMDSIGQKPVVRDESRASLRVVFDKGRNRWLVSLKSPLVDEK